MCGADNDVGMLSRVCLDDSASIMTSNKKLIERYTPYEPSDEERCVAQAIDDLLSGVDIFTEEESRALLVSLCTE